MKRAVNILLFFILNAIKVYATPSTTLWTPYYPITPAECYQKAWQKLFLKVVKLKKEVKICAECLQP
jgi:hypothetical protein